MEVALEAAKPLGKVVSHTVIASPSEDTEIALKMTILKINNNTSSLETFEDQNDYLLG